MQCKVNVKTSNKNDKLKIHEALEDKIPRNLSCSALACKICLFSYEILPKDFASQLLPQCT